MIEELVAEYESGLPLYVGEVRDRFASSGYALEYRLTLADGQTVKPGRVPLPPDLASEGRAYEIAYSYLQAEVYNLLTTLGGRRLALYRGAGSDAIRKLVDDVVASFGVELPRSERAGVGRVVNVIERMLDSLGTGDATHPSGRARFVIDVVSDGTPPDVLPLRFQAQPNGVFSRVAAEIGGRTYCGLDVGGTDIKAALAVDGELVAMKEHDWNPALFSDVELLIDPIVDTVLLLNAYAILAARRERGEKVAEQLSLCRSCLGKDVSPGRLHQAAEELDRFVDGERVLDGIGLSFPDVVVNNKIVGGEVPKTLGMRSNKDREFETQFSQLTTLDERLQALCRPGGTVVSMNDGPMAAFTAAVEIAAGENPEQVAHGVFAHTLGTDLGTGLVLADGSIPAIPLEAYNMILDIGSSAARQLASADVRSLRNTNTDVIGTMQRFTSQTGAFRLAHHYFTSDAPHLLDQAAESGFLREEAADGSTLTIVPETPSDMRKAYLAHLMELSTSEPAAAEIFRDIGEFLALTWKETEHILGTGITSRFLFGRLVKVPRCFELMREGAARRSDELELIAADSSMSNTPLMKQLDAMEGFTVAQFGQAIGAVYSVRLAEA